MYGAVNAPMYPYNQTSQIAPGNHGYTSFQGYTFPGHQIVQFGGPTVNATASPMQTIQAAYTPGSLFSSRRFVF